MTSTFDYGEPVTIRQSYTNLAGAPAAQVTCTITITDSAGTAKVTAGAMTLEATGTYSYIYTVPTAGPSGIWTYTTTGTDASGYLSINSGSFLVASTDTLYTTVENVRELLPDLLYKDEDCGEISSGTTITLVSSAFSVPTILKDTTTLYHSTNYTFVKPKSITLVSAAAGEHYIARLDIGFSNQQIQKFIARSDRIIYDYFYTATAPTSAYKDDWSSLLTAAFILKIKAKGDPGMIAWSVALEKQAMDGMVSYKKGVGGTIFDDTKVKRDDATTVKAFALDQQTVKNYETND